MFMGAGQPRGGKRVRFVGVDHIEAAVAQQPPDLPGRGQAPENIGHDLHRQSSRARSFRQCGTAHGKQFGAVPSRTQSSEQQQSLALAAAPDSFQVHE
jgi:hypothetical protein